MNWIVNVFLILVISYLTMRIAQIFKCNSNGKNCDVCSWLDICYDYNEHSQLLKPIPNTTPLTQGEGSAFCEDHDTEVK